MSWIKILFLNVLVFSVFWLLTELAYHAFRPTAQHCYHKWVEYGYCPNIEFSRKNNQEDGGGLINIRTDAIGGRIGSLSQSTKDTAQLIFIGDSFIQADEVNYDETIYGNLNKHSKEIAYGLGYSSWNPLQYRDAIRKIGRKNVHYFIFLMLNDINPNYERSVFFEKKTPKKSELRKTISGSLTSKTGDLLLNKIPLFFASVDSDIQQPPTYTFTPEMKTLFTEQMADNCKPIDQVQNTSYQDKLGFDYLVYSKNSSCWPPKHRIAYEAFLNVVREIDTEVRVKLKSNVTYVWVSGGWAFKNQNSIGRMSSPYSIPTDFKISHKAVVNKFKKDMSWAEVLDTESIIESSLSACKIRCIDKYFFPLDGHWTGFTHGLISDFFRERYF